MTDVRLIRYSSLIVEKEVDYAKADRDAKWSRRE